MDSLQEQARNLGNSLAAQLVEDILNPPTAEESARRIEAGRARDLALYGDPAYDEGYAHSYGI